MSYDSKGTVNKVMLIGNIGADPELKYTPSNTAVCSFSIATTTSYKDAAGNNQEQTEWHKIVAWRKLAEIIAQYGSKGSKVYVEGRLTTRSWEDQNGTKRYTTEVVADSIQLLGGKRQQDNAEAAEATEGQQEYSEDDLPF